MFAITRLARACVTLFFVLTVVFLAGRASGDPTFYLLPANASESERMALREALGLDRTLFEQYRIFLGNVLTGDFGTSFFSGRSVVEMFVERLPNTLALMLPTLGLSLAIAITIGTIAALRRGTAADQGLMLIALIGQATPNFALGIALLLIFSFGLGWLPSGGTGSLAHYVLPVIALGMATLASLARLMRASLLDVLRQDYVRFARARGLAPATVLLNHAMRTALLPIVTVVGLQVGTLIGGAVIVEAVFAWPGAGRLLVDAVLNRDFPMIQFGVLAVATAVIAANAVVDLAYGALDPRTRMRMSR